MALKLGYKMTEIGIVPEDWEVKKLDELGECIIGLTYSPANVSNYGLLVLRSSNIKDSRLIYKDSVFVDLNNINQKLIVMKNDLLICVRNGSRRLIGKCALIDSKADGSTFGAFMSVFRSEYGQYIYYCFNSSIIKSQLERVLGATINQITNHDMKDFIIPLPRQIAEQRAIVNTLSDIDELILSLEKLIAKKKDIKQGTMQQLLSGKKRLAGFNGQWIEKSLDELFNISGGFSASREQLSTKGYCYLHYGDIHGSKTSNIDIERDYSIIPKLDVPLKTISSFLLSDGDVVFVDASEDLEGASKCLFVRNPSEAVLIAGVHTIVAKAKTDEISKQYREFCFLSEVVREQFRYYAAGTKVIGISKSNILKISIRFPERKDEQTAIATILSDMDSEIEALEKKLKKCREIEQGMMEELLTGRIRLVKTTEKIQPRQKDKTQNHNEHFNEAVVLSVLVSMFSSKQYPVGRFKRQKLAYLLHRHIEGTTRGFLKKAAGPYNPSIKYKDETIALKNKYVKKYKTDKAQGLVPSENIEQAIEYFKEWYGEDAITWLEQFRYTKNEEMELLATVDMAITDLKTKQQKITVDTVKSIICSNKEWKPKLERATFSDRNIQKAIKWSNELFGDC